MKVGILYVRRPQEIGGGHTFISGLLDEIRTASFGHEFIIFCVDSASHEASDSVPTINLVSHYPDRVRTMSSILKKVAARIRLPLPARAATVQNTKQELLSRAIRDFGIDIIWNVGIAHYGEIPSPFIFNVWDLQHRLQPYFPEVSLPGWRWQSREDFYRENLRRASIVLTGTAVGRDEIIHFYGLNPDNVSVVPFPVPPIPEIGESEAVLEKYNLGSAYLLYPAQFWPHKNHVNAIRALRILHDTKAAGLDLVFTGSDAGNKSFVMNAVGSLGLEAHVHFLGFVPRSDLMALYKKAFALLYPTFFGPDNLPPLEAFALGCPVLASDVPGAAEQLSDAAILFDPADPQSIQNSIRRLQDNPALRADLIAKGKQVIEDRSQKHYIEAVCRILDRFESIRCCWHSSYKDR